MKKLRKITFEETGRRAHDSGVVYAIVIVIPFIVGLLGIGDLYIAALVFAFVATAINEADIQRRNGESLWTTIWCSLIAGLSLTTLAILSGLFGIMASMRWVK